MVLRSVQLALLFALASAAACKKDREVGAAPSTPVELSEGLTTSAEVLGIAVGGPLAPHVGRLTGDANSAAAYQFRELGALRLGGLPVDDLRVLADGDRVSDVVISVSAGKEQMVALRQATVTVCEPFGRVDRIMPSPLGTPPDGGEWDPVMLTLGECEGELGGVRVFVREEQSETNEHTSGWMTVRLSVPTG